MNEYRVTWTIEVEADSPQQAAEMARDAQEPGTHATVFEVFDTFGTVTKVDVASVADAARTTWYCFDCDATWSTDDDTPPPCPHCGSRRVDDDDDIGRFPLPD